jgi:hypothetical protein
MTEVADQWANEHYDTPRLTCRFLVNMFEIEFLGRCYDNIVSLPFDTYADRLEHFDKPVHFFDARHFAESCLALIEECGAQETHGTVL